MPQEKQMQSDAISILGTLILSIVVIREAAAASSMDRKYPSAVYSKNSVSVMLG